MKFIEEIYNKLISENELIVSYYGIVDESELEKLLKIIEEKSISLPKTIQRRLFFIAVELLQNLFHYALIKDEETEKDVNLCHFCVTIDKKTEFFKITTGNFVNRKQLLKLVNRIEYVNKKNSEDLHNYYKEILNNSKYTDKGGGLGIIDIKRKSQNKLDYQYIKLNKNLYFFNFSVFLENKI